MSFQNLMPHPTRDRQGVFPAVHSPPRPWPGDPPGLDGALSARFYLGRENVLFTDRRCQRWGVGMVAEVFLIGAA